MSEEPRDQNGNPIRPADNRGEPTVPFEPKDAPTTPVGPPDWTDPEAETSAVDDKVARTTPLGRPPPGGPAPERIAGYRLMGQIGRGGMGTVFMAQRLDDRFQKRVAIKIMRRGMDTDEMLERFKLERQVLGALNHPNIARLFDAGRTEDGRPYFVMEHVEGVAIDTYCDENNLTVPERVRLFTKVCGAVHYAHQNLIVHRDLKPSNILVTGEGEPKLLDFGIAKLLNPELLGLPALTRADQRIMTYEYASPEQVQGQQITTASDVYALGVILYELLTGHRPYQIERRVHAEAVRVICEEEPERPSTAVSKAATRHTNNGEMQTITASEIAKRREAQIPRLKRHLVGDLDNVIMMAMRKSAPRRYPTAQALSDDLVRHLEGQTVTARAPTFGYRAGKFLRRNRAAVTAASLVFVALLVGVIGFSWAWVRAEDALAREGVALIAARQSEDAERSARVAAEDRYGQLKRMFTIEDALYEEIENLPGSTAARDVLSEAMLSAIGSLYASFPEDPRLRRDLAVQYRRIGVLATGSESSLARGIEALETARELLENAPETDEEHFIVGVRLANALWRAGQRDRAVLVANDTADRCAAIAGNPGAPGLLDAYHAGALTQTAIVRTLRARYDDAADLLIAAIGLASEAVEAHPDNPEAVRALAHAHEMLAVLHGHRGLAEEELASYLDTIALRERVVELAPRNAEARRRLYMINERIGRALMSLGRFDEAKRSFDEARALALAETEADPFSVQAKSDLARSFENAGDLAVKLDRLDVAVTLYRAFLDATEDMVAADPLEVNNRRSLSIAHFQLGDALYARAKRAEKEDAASARGIYNETASHQQDAVAILREISDANPADAVLRGDLTRALRRLGNTYERMARLEGGDPGLLDKGLLVLSQALAEAEAYAEHGGDLTDLHDDIYRTATALCNIALKVERGDAIVSTTDRVDPLLDSHNPTRLEQRRTNVLGYRALGQAMLGRYEDALGTVRLALSRFPEGSDPETNSTYRRFLRMETEYTAQLVEEGDTFAD